MIYFHNFDNTTLNIFLKNVLFRVFICFILLLVIAALKSAFIRLYCVKC
jgi:hypothetical protein